MQSDRVEFVKLNKKSYNNLLQPDVNTLYFVMDTNELYLGSKRFNSGRDTKYETNGKGEYVSAINFDEDTKTVTVTRTNNIADAESLKAKFDELQSKMVVEITADNESPIKVNNSDPQHPSLWMRFAQDTKGNIDFWSNAEGLAATLNMDKFDTSSIVDSDDEVLQVKKNKISSKLALQMSTTKNGDIVLDLVGKERNNVISSVTIDLPDQETLTDARLTNNKVLQLVIAQDNGSIRRVECDLSELVDKYIAAQDGGLQLRDNAFSIDNNIRAGSFELKVNTNHELQFSQLDYDEHGLITRNTSSLVQLPRDIEAGTYGDGASPITQLTIKSDGAVEVKTVDIATRADDNNPNALVTVSALQDFMDQAGAIWS